MYGWKRFCWSVLSQLNLPVEYWSVYGNDVTEKWWISIKITFNLNCWNHIYVKMFVLVCSQNDNVKLYTKVCFILVCNVEVCSNWVCEILSCSGVIIHEWCFCCEACRQGKCPTLDVYMINIVCVYNVSYCISPF